VALGVAVAEAEAEGVAPSLEPLLGPSPLLQALSTRTKTASAEIAERRGRPKLKVREVMR
jgi:hypothetical protein